MGAHSVRHKMRGGFIAVVVFLVLLVVPVVLANAYYQTYNSLTAQQVAKEQTLSDIAARALKIKLDKLVNIASSLASTPQIISFAEKKQWTDAISVARDLSNSVDFYDPFIDRIIIYDATATQQAAYPSLTGGLGTSAVSSSWYSTLLNGSQPVVVTNVLERISLPQIQVVSIVAPIRSASGIKGFIVMQIPTDNFLEFAGNLDLGTYGFGYVVDSTGNIVAHPKFFSDGGAVVNYSFIPEVKKVVAGESGSDVVSSQTNSEKSIITYKPVDNYGWGIITQELYSEAFSVRSNILFGLGTLIGITVIADILISCLVFMIIIRKKHE
jgi:hypothetical protein